MTWTLHDVVTDPRFRSLTRRNDGLLVALIEVEPGMDWSRTAYDPDVLARVVGYLIENDLPAIRERRDRAERVCNPEPSWLVTCPTCGSYEQRAAGGSRPDRCGSCGRRERDGVGVTEITARGRP